MANIESMATSTLIDDESAGDVAEFPSAAEAVVSVRDRQQRSRISIIVPVLNEAPLIRPLLRHLRDRAPTAQIIVVDGGSCDDTKKLAIGLCDELLSAKANRAEQMNAGARVATGDIFWFVHADARVPTHCLDEIERVLSDPRVDGGFFRITLPRSNVVYRLTDTFAHYAGLCSACAAAITRCFAEATSSLRSADFPRCR